MQFSDRQLTAIAVGGAVLLLVVYIAHSESGGNAPPRYETNSNPNLGYVIDRLDTGDHYFHPAHTVPGQQVMFLPHRYPDANGPNITSLIHPGGFDRLARPAPADDDWRTIPPGEMQW